MRLRLIIILYLSKGLALVCANLVAVFETSIMYDSQRTINSWRFCCSVALLSCRCYEAGRPLEHRERCEAWGGEYSFVSCLSHLTIDHASLSRRSTIPTPNRDTSNMWPLITFSPCATNKPCACLIPFLSNRLWPPYTRYLLG